MCFSKAKIVDRNVFYHTPPIGKESSHLISIVRFMTWLVLPALFSCTFSDPYCNNEDCLGASLDEGVVGYRVLLIGDTGANIDQKNRDRPAKIPIFTAVQRFAEILPARTAIVFLGDNIYRKGLPDATERPLRYDKGCTGRACAERRLDVQIDIIRKSKARGIFIPGNHDWDGGGRRGLKRIRNQEEYIKNSSRNENVDAVMIPQNGCPGPVTVSLSGNETEVSLIGLDTQWWLHKYKKPRQNDNPENCQPVTKQEIIRSLTKQIEGGRRVNRHVLIVAHHPLITYGKHAGFFSYKDLLNPIHLFSQLLINAGFAGRQEMPNPVYRDMRMKIQGTIEEARGEGREPLIYAAGHDHSLQAIEGQKRILYLVSGAGTPWKASRVGHKKGTLFSHSSKRTGGFMMVDFMRSGRIRLAVIEPQSVKDECKNDEGKECVVFSTWVN